MEIKLVDWDECIPFAKTIWGVKTDYSFNGGQMIAMYVGDEIVGISGIERYMEDSWEVTWTAVAKEYRGQGIATELVKYVLDYLWETDEIYGQCMAMNDKAFIGDVMESLGFQCIEKRRDFWTCQYEDCCHYSGSNCHCDNFIYKLTR